MVKRNREEGGAEPIERRAKRTRNVERELRIGVMKLGHAFKVSKGFERQKLGRRQKKAAAQDDQKDVVRIDSEVAALKILDTAAFAQQHFYKSLLKIKAVAEHAELPAKVKKPPDLPQETALLNVHARLCNANHVKDALAPAIVSIQQALGLEPDPVLVAKKRRLRAKDYESGKPTASPQVEKQKGSPAARELSSVEGEEEFAEFEDRVAASSDEDQDGTLDVEAIEQRLAAEGAIQRKRASSRPDKYSLEADLSISGSESEADSTTPEPEKAPAAKRLSFLPSLTMGGYISGSGSDIDDEIDAAPKKNRRGQRARQQIWEKKFGSQAKHLQKPARDEGWDHKRGAVERGERSWTSNRQERRAGPDYTAGGNRETIESKPRDPIQRKKPPVRDGPIHPSWEAAKKAKEKKEIPVTFQGKKITFQ